MEATDTLMEEQKLMTEAKYRNYMTNIEKALRQFEYSSEWADLISALGKLNKAISSNTQYQVIPRRIKISKRLAQCMHPALPSGVHLKAVETYGVIFSKTGPERLATELFIYSAGLFPLLGYAAMNVRPALLRIYETYFVPLGERLRPALSGFLSGVLPGYESGLDHFERTNSLLNQVCAAVNPTHFYTVLWECVATNASIRLPAITYLLEHFNKRLGMEEQVYIMGHNRDVMMCGLCACLNDTVILVQRNTLEFLLLGFPMHTPYLMAGDLVRLLTNGLNTILRRDMSLNRRFYSWLLGTEVAKNSPTYDTASMLDGVAGSSAGGGGGGGGGGGSSPPNEPAVVETYFERHSKAIIIRAIIGTLKASLESKPVDLRPYSIMVSLLDKADIGSEVLDYVLCDIIRTTSLSSEGNVQVVKLANLLFATFDPAYIWSFMAGMYEKSCQQGRGGAGKPGGRPQARGQADGAAHTNTQAGSAAAAGKIDERFRCVVGSGDPCLVEICYLTEFLLETISLEMYTETTRIYLPKVFLAITQTLTLHLEGVSSEEIAASLRLCMKIVSRVQPMITSPIKLMPRISQGYSSSDERAAKEAHQQQHNSNAVPSMAGHGCAAVTITGLEKSKSDSKLNQFSQNKSCALVGGAVAVVGDGKELLCGSMGSASAANCNDEPIRRSCSNQHMERKSPTKSKKKAKSYSKLSELDKEICPDTGQIIEPHPSSSDLDTPLSIKKLKSKAHFGRIRTSPKKTRPKDIAINEPRSLDPAMLRHDATNEDGREPRSAPPMEPKMTNHQQGDDNLYFDYHNVPAEETTANSEREEFTILEKCIRQYEIFYEIYLSQAVLRIRPNLNEGAALKSTTTSSAAQQPSNKKETSIAAQDICGIRLQVERQCSAASAFRHEHVHEDVCPQRLREIELLFGTLCVNVVSRSKHLKGLLQRSLGYATSAALDGSSAGNSNGDGSEADYRDCVSSVASSHASDSAAEQQQQHSRKGFAGDLSEAESTENSIQSLIELRLTAARRTAIKLASNLLVEMSTFPNCNKNIMLDKSENELPNWLKVLCLVAAYTQSDRELQLVAITTLFDLISLLKSQIEHATSPGVTFVVMLPLLKFGHVSYLERRTRLFHLVTSILWDYLGTGVGVDPAQVTALLYQLHNCLDSGVVEAVIGDRMYAHSLQQQFAAAGVLASEGEQQQQQQQEHRQQQEYWPANALRSYQHDRAAQIQLMCVSPVRPVAHLTLSQLQESEACSFKKFELLWHLGRDKQPSRGFERTLLRVLDTLGLPHYMAVRTFVTRWLQAALLRGDLGRLVKPLYRILLAGNTRRIGIVHLHALLGDGGDGAGVDGIAFGGGLGRSAGGGLALEGGGGGGNAALEQDVYAIRSEYGNVKYYQQTHKKRSPIRTFHKKIFGVKLSSKNKTANFVSDKAPAHATGGGGGRPGGTVASPTPTELSGLESGSAIGLIVNPLDGSPDFEDELEAEEATVAMRRRSTQSRKDPEGAVVGDVREQAENPQAPGDDDDDEDDNDDDVDDNNDDDDDADEEEEVDFEHDFTDDSESSLYESESEQRETSVEKDDSLTTSSLGGGGGGTSLTAAMPCEAGTNSLKRYAGDCERVTEALTQHERTKNRKTYRLTREKTPGDVSLNSTTTNTTTVEEEIGSCGGGDDDAAHPAEEYFNQQQQLADEMIVEKRSTASASPTKSGGLNKLHRHSHPAVSAKKITTSGKAVAAGKAKVSANSGGGGGEKKRMSCISKTSTDSNNSGVLAAQSDEDGIVSGTPDTATTTMSTTTTTTTINVEEKRRQLSLETNRPPSQKMADWELTPETLEKSKQNVQILRQNAAAAAAAKQKHSATGGRGSSSSDGSAHKQHTTAAATTSSPSTTTTTAMEQQRLLAHAYHNHILVYAGVYDTKQTLYALQTLRNVIAADARTFLCLSITTSLSSGGTLKQLLIRHRKSVAGRGFGGSVANSEYAQSYRGCMQLEVLVTVCLSYARGFFYGGRIEEQSVAKLPLAEDALGNCRVQLESVELLTLVCGELIDIVRGMGKGLACYIADLLGRCKLQKIVLHCLNASVHASRARPEEMLRRDATLAERILHFNTPHDDHLHAEALQVQLLRLLMAVIKLEHEVLLLQNAGDPVGGLASAAQSGVGGGSSAGLDANGNISPTRIGQEATAGTGGGGGGGGATSSGPAAANVKYLPNCAISQQPMFLAAVLSALQADRLRHLHRNWTHLVTASLSCFSAGSLTNIVISVVHQLCSNVDRIARLPLREQCAFPPDYAVSQLEAITVLCHYCLLDSTLQTTISHLFNQVYPQTSVAVPASAGGSGGGGGGALLNNIVHSFLPTANTAAAAANSAPAKQPQLQAARNAVLSHLSRIVATVAAVWDSELGQVRQIKQQLLEFLSPVSLHHGANFLAAIAVTWQERGEAHQRRQRQCGPSLSVAEQYQRNSQLQAAVEQMSLVTLVASIRVMPMDSFVQTLHQVVKTPPPIHRPPAHLAIEVSALELFYFYMKSAPTPQLGESWSSLLVLLRDGLSLAPPAQFALLMLLNEFVQRCPQMPFQDKKDVRDLHDVTSRLVDSLANVAGSCLEQITWLRRNLAVKEDIPAPMPTPSLATSGSGSLSGAQSLGGGSAGGGSSAGSAGGGGSSGGGGGGVGNPNSSSDNGSGMDTHDDAATVVMVGSQQQQYAVQAQSVLAAVLANLLDVAYGSQEKDKVVAIVTTLLYNITPYLRNHTPRNVPSFYACSALLASLSQYQYTRKAWRKDTFDLLLDPAFFQMHLACLPLWRQIMDSLMTYDNTTFRELMNRVSLTQTGSLNIFTSRDQECEQRAMLLKRLAFVIYCSEFDQYCKYVPEIQEQLVNSLRLLSMFASVQSAVFLCFRVLLLRMSPDHVTSLWPIIIAEMVQVFLSMEQELKSESDYLNMDTTSWSASSSNNGLISPTQIQHWRSVQLEASKILELGCVLPATNLPHFQMYRWAFVGTEFDAHEEVALPNGNTAGLPVGVSPGEEFTTAALPTTLYVPHVRRIARLMDMKYAVHSPLTNSRRGQHLVLTCQQIITLQDLYAFFSTLSVSCPNPRNYAADGEKELASCLAEIEQILAKDFLERMPNSSAAGR